MKCWECDKEGTKQFITNGCESLSWFNDDYCEVPSKRWYCEECYDRIQQERKKDREEYVRLKKKLMLERAMRMLENQQVNPYDYLEAYETIKEYSEKNPDKFDSSHEMVTAMILIDNEIQTKTQYKIAGYRVDFYLPELKIILEIDGALYHKHRKKHDSNRDAKIRAELGSDVEIIRLDTKFIEQKAELIVEAIKTIRKERQKLRRNNFGELPSWYKC